MDQDHLERLCVRCTANPSDTPSLKRLQRACSTHARNIITSHKLVLPTEPIIAYRQFKGDGSISFGKTISEFSRRGRNFENIVGRLRIKTVIKLNIMIIYDDSNSMTHWWRKQRFGTDMKPENSPQTLAKLASMLVLEGFGRDADVGLITFGSGVSGPFTKREIIYKELISKKGSGGTRMDLALEKLIRSRWDKEGGANILVIITDGLPETGWHLKSVPYISETKEPGASDPHKQKLIDTEVQWRTTLHLKHLMQEDVYVLFVPLFFDYRLTSWVSGAHSARTFTEELHNMGATIAPVLDTSKMSEIVFEGLHSLPIKKMVDDSIYS